MHYIHIQVPQLAVNLRSLERALWKVTVPPKNRNAAGADVYRQRHVKPVIHVYPSLGYHVICATDIQDLISPNKSSDELWSTTTTILIQAPDYHVLNIIIACKNGTTQENNVRKLSIAFNATFSYTISAASFYLAVMKEHFTVIVDNRCSNKAGHEI